MKVYIGPYIHYWGPYQLAGLLRFIGIGDETREKFGDFLARTWVGDFCQWVHDRRSRTVKIKIHNYDSWNAEKTLALVILPVIRQLRANALSMGHIDDEDVPEHLRSTNAPLVNDELGEVDDLYEQRWNWALDEMIWAFENYLSDWEDKYYTGEFKYHWKEYEDEKVYKLIEEPDSTFKFDRDGYQAEYERMENAFRLFGKYYMSLWD